MRILGEKFGYKLSNNPYMGVVNPGNGTGRAVCIWNMDRIIPRIHNQKTENGNIGSVECTDNSSVGPKSVEELDISRTMEM